MGLGFCLFLGSLGYLLFFHGWGKLQWVALLKIGVVKMARNYSTFDIARMLGVDPSSVANWIDQGLLKAHRTPGGHRRVITVDLVGFLREHKMPIPEELGLEPSKVLVADADSEITRSVANAIKLSHPEVQVVEANDSFQVGMVITTMRPNIVVLDIDMPGMDGFEVCRLVKSQGTTQRVEVIAIASESSDAESKKKILDCGAKTCISKPFDLNALLQEIEVSL